METQNISPLFQSNCIELEQLKIFKDLPDELILKILSLLSHQQLSIYCGVSKSWKRLCEDDFLWKGWGERLDIEETQRNKQTIISRIVQLKKDAREAFLSLNQQVKTLEEIGIPIAHKKLTAELTEGDRIVIKNMFQEITRKVELSSLRERGFQAHLSLRRIGLSTLEQLHQFANVLQTSHGYDKAPMLIALELVEENQLIEVENILNSTLKDKSERYEVINAVINQLCRQDKIQDAFEFFKTHVSLPIVEKNLNELWLHIKDSIDIFFSHAEEKKLFALRETLISTYIPKKECFSKVTYLIEAYIKEKMFPQAKVLLQKHQKDLENQKHRHEIISLIQIYVSLDEIQGAWNLALNYQGKDLLPLYILRNAFANISMKEEKEKVEEVIKSKETK